MCIEGILSAKLAKKYTKLNMISKKKFKTKKIAEIEKQSTVKVDCQPDWHLPLRTRMVHIYSQHCTCTMYSMKASR